MDLEFTPINMKTWIRRDSFLSFTKIMPASYSFTVDIDVTATLDLVKKNKINFFATCLWIIHIAVNSIEEFRLGYHNHTLGIYREVMPLFPVFHSDTETCTLFWMKVNSNFSEFYADYSALLTENMGCRSSLCMASGRVPENFYNISMEQRINFAGFAIQMPFIDKEPRLQPIILAGKYVEKNGKVMMPLSLTIHHAAADGYQSSRFFDKISEYFRNPDEWFSLK